MGSEFWKDGLLLLDGAMGTVLQQRGLKPGELPELIGITRPELLRSIHREYIDAGSRVVCANTFGANALKLAHSGYTVEEVVRASIAAAKQAAAGTGTRVALDIGPLGEQIGRASCRERVF